MLNILSFVILSRVQMHSLIGVNLLLHQQKDTYLHLIYNSEQDMEGLVQKYPDREVLEKLYPELTKLAETNGNFIKIENLYQQIGHSKT